MPRNASDILIDGLIAWGIDIVFGLPGDGINGVIEALRTRQDKIRFVQARHEEAAAFMACGYAKWTGRIGCCLATTGPGGIHLLNGLYDAKGDGVPVLAITGLPYHDLIDTHTQQDVDHNKLFADVAAYTTRIQSVAQVESAVALACRTARARHGVAHIAIPTDVQEQMEGDVSPSPRNKPHHASYSWQEPPLEPDLPLIEAAAGLLRGGERIAILAGQGALGARGELRDLADRLGAPIVKALLGKALVPDSDPLTTGGIGLLGTRPSQEVMERCDTLLIVGSTFPYIEYYPKPGQARCVQIDRDPTRIGLRYPAEIGIAADAGATLRALNRALDRREDRRFLADAQRWSDEWRRLMRESANRPGLPLKPQRVVRDLSDLLSPDAIVAVDSGQHTGICARLVEMQDGQMFSTSGSMASMGAAIPYAVAAGLAHPGRQVVAVTGDGGLSMVLGELATCVRYGLSTKVLVLRNNTLGQIKWEQMMFLGNPEFGCDLQPIDFGRAAEAMGFRSFRIVRPEESRAVLEEALRHDGPVLIDAEIDPNEPLLPPKRMPNYADNLQKALDRGTPGAEDIKRALAEEPAATLLKP